MTPLIAVALRWFIVGVATSIGWEVGKVMVGGVNQDNWISKGIEETKEGLKQTWTGRATQIDPKDVSQESPQCDKPNCCGH